MSCERYEVSVLLPSLNVAVKGFTVATEEEAEKRMIEEWPMAVAVFVTKKEEDNVRQY